MGKSLRPDHLRTDYVGAMLEAARRRADLMIQMREAGMTLRQIAELAGCSRQRVRQILARHLEHNRKPELFGGTRQAQG